MNKHTLNFANKQDSKVALVTGGARRIGASIVQVLHNAGFKVVIHCHHSLEKAHALALSLNNERLDSALVLQGNLCSPYTSINLIQCIKDWAGRLDLLINNASIFIRTQIDKQDLNEWDLLFNTNVRAPFLLSLTSRELLAQTQGSIINITDIHAQNPLKEYSIYCQSKAALEMQTKSLAKELGPEIRVNAIAPGAILWPEENNSLNLKEQNKIINKTILKRHGQPEFIAQAVLALAENPFITGQILKVDGGRT